MAFDDLYRRLEQSRRPVDLEQDPEATAEADQVVYRLGFSSVPLAGMPDELQIGRVEVHRVVGPIATQRVLMRQRHGLPITFDKSMDLGLEVGTNEILTICQIADSPPDEWGQAFRNWREEVFAACGVLSAILDGRVAIEQRFEDAIQIRGQEPFSSMDSKSLVRSFLPFDVTATETVALNELGSLQLTAVAELAQAARWYMRATHEGPTVDAIVTFWIAIETLTPQKSTSSKVVEAMLLGAGFDPAWLGDLTVGRLAGLRAEIVHKGQADEALIRNGYYRLEAVARVLIRRAAGVESSWPPVLTAGVFGKEREKVELQLVERETVWHEGGLPPPAEPDPSGLDWERVQLVRERGEPPMEVSLEGDVQPGYRERVLHWVTSAGEFLDVPFDPMVVAIDDDTSDVPEGVEMRVNREGLFLRPGLFTLPDPLRELRLGWLIQKGLAEMAVMRSRIDYYSFGIALIALAGAWAGWRAFYGPEAPLEGEDLEFSEFADDDLRMIGETAGLVLAGSGQAERAFEDWASRADSGMTEIVRGLIQEWDGVESFPDLLSGIKELAEVMRNLQGPQ